MSFKIVNKDYEKEPFQEDKLYNSAYYPGLEAEVGEKRANNIAEKVVWEVKAWMSEHEDHIFTSKEVRTKVMDILKRENRDVAVMYKTHLDLN